MIEIRKLMREEFLRLLNEAPKSETNFIRSLGEDAYDFFERKSIVIQGFVIDSRPLYIAAVMEGKNNRYVFWTVVNSDVKDTFSLCKYSKRQLNIWLKKFGNIYATMGKENNKNQKWVEWLGFKKIEEDLDTITYKLGD